MIADPAATIRAALERTYDIPFLVKRTVRFSEPLFEITPKDGYNELFLIEASFRNQIRLTIQVTPQRYAAFSIKDMADASAEKKKHFADYASQLNGLKAKTEFYINDSLCSLSEPETWPSEWKSYRLRVTRSPICGEDEIFDEARIATPWVVIVAGMFLSLLNVISTEETVNLEGGVRRVETNRYERNPVNRELCLAANGYTCSICGFDFERIYGILGHHFIHVHHIVPVSAMRKAYEINPVTDLIPVCPNCHAMLHKVDPPLLPEELRNVINNTNRLMNL